MSSSLQTSLDEKEVFELVCDYLRTRHFFHAERALIQERSQTQCHRSTSHPQHQLSKANNQRTGASKLESLLERSYVTLVVSGNGAFPSPAPTHTSSRRDHLDGNNDVFMEADGMINPEGKEYHMNI